MRKIYKYISIREMEENKETSVDSNYFLDKGKKVAEELKNIDKI
jgi:hypothetical protein